MGKKVVFMVLIKKTMKESFILWRKALIHENIMFFTTLCLMMIILAITSLFIYPLRVIGIFTILFFILFLGSYIIIPFAVVILIAHYYYESIPIILEIEFFKSILKDLKETIVALTGCAIAMTISLIFIWSIILIPVYMLATMFRNEISSFISIVIVFLLHSSLLIIIVLMINEIMVYKNGKEGLITGIKIYFQNIYHSTIISIIGLAPVVLCFMIFFLIEISPLMILVAGPLAILVLLSSSWMITLFYVYYRNIIEDIL